MRATGGRSAEAEEQAGEESKTLDAMLESSYSHLIVADPPVATANSGGCYYVSSVMVVLVLA